MLYVLDLDKSSIYISRSLLFLAQGEKEQYYYKA